MLLSCKTEVPQNAFDAIMAQDSFYKNHPTVEKKFFSKQIDSDSLWIIQLFVNDEVITRGYVKNTDFILTILDTASGISSYRGDTLFDANFDGARDYIINYYSGTGCCPRSQSRIFLFDTTKHVFLPKMEMLNTYFDPKNKTVLSMDYGYPAVHMGIALSKNKWRKDSLVTIEDIFFNEDSSLTLHSYDSEKDIPLKELPDDYKHIPQVDWFTLK